MRIILYYLIICLFTSCISLKSNDILFKEDFQSLSNHWVLEGHTFSSNLADFNPDNIQIKEGLVLHLNYKPSMEKQFGGAEIRTKKRYKYGKFSATIKAPKDSGIVSAFFLYNGATKKYNEVDFEFLGKNDMAIHTNHWVNSVDNGQSIPLMSSFEKGFHDYTIEWRKDFIAWSVDGREIYRTEKDIPQVPMQLVFNIWISKYEDWAGTFNPNVLPQKLNIKSVRIFR